MVQTSDRCCLSQVSEVNSGGLVDSLHADNEMRMAFYSVVVLQNHKFCLNRTETTGKPIWKDFLSAPQPVLLETVKIIQNQQSLRNCHSLEGLREPRWLR